MKRIIQLVMIFILAFALVACKKEKGGEKAELKSVSVVTNRNVARVQVGHTLQCSYKVSPVGVTVDSVKWSVSSQLGTISESGLFTAGNEPGLVKISVEAKSGDTVVTGLGTPNTGDVLGSAASIVVGTTASGGTTLVSAISPSKSAVTGAGTATSAGDHTHTIS